MPKINHEKIRFFLQWMFLSVKIKFSLLQASVFHWIVNFKYSCRKKVLNFNVFFFLMYWGDILLSLWLLNFSKVYSTKIYSVALYIKLVFENVFVNWTIIVHKLSIVYCLAYIKTILVSYYHILGNIVRIVFSQHHTC